MVAFSQHYLLFKTSSTECFSVKICVFLDRSRSCRQCPSGKAAGVGGRWTAATVRLCLCATQSSLIALLRVGPVLVSAILFRQTPEQVLETERAGDYPERSTCQTNAPWKGGPPLLAGLAVTLSLEFGVTGLVEFITVENTPCGIKSF